MAYAVLVAAQSRFLGQEFTDAHAGGSVVLPPPIHGEAMESRRVAVEERPPLSRIARSLAGEFCAARRVR